MLWLMGSKITPVISPLCFETARLRHSPTAAFPSSGQRLPVGRWMTLRSGALQM
jgi:hypothetical protein